MPITSTPRPLTTSLALLVTAALASVAAPLGANPQGTDVGDKDAKKK